MNNKKHPNCPSSFIFHQARKALPDNNISKSNLKIMMFDRIKENIGTIITYKE
jgi:hypothetical protein